MMAVVQLHLFRHWSIFTVSGVNVLSSVLTVFVGPPDVATGVVGVAGFKSAGVSWVAPADYGVVISRYVVTESVGGLTEVVDGSPASASLTFTGLTNGVTYRFSVVAVNNAGSSGASSVSVGVTPLGENCVVFCLF